MTTIVGSMQPVIEDHVEETSQDDLPTSGNSIRRRFLEFYESKGHKILPSSSLVHDDDTDKSVLFTIAGMLPFKPVFLGKVQRQVPRATTSQRCIRTNDIKNVGKTSRHHTFFEMLGNFSFGDYFKKEAIEWAWELITIEYRLPIENLWISVYEKDEETYAIWHDEIGVSANHIKKMGEEDNFWMSGKTGPCGPCSEIYYDFHPEKGYSNVDLNDDTRFLEFYNLVFMQFDRKDGGSLEELKEKHIDTGMGLERMARILQKVPNNYETDLIFPIVEKVAELAEVSYVDADDSTKTKLKVIGDHMRTIVHLMSDGVKPSNKLRGYVVKMLIRRSILTGKLLGINGGKYLQSIAETVIAISSKIDPDLKSRTPSILEDLKQEELRYWKTLEKGENELQLKLENAKKEAKTNNTNPLLSGKDAFYLSASRGYPVELTIKKAHERGVSVDMISYDIEKDKQRRQSQEAHQNICSPLCVIIENIQYSVSLAYDTLNLKAVINFRDLEKVREIVPRGREIMEERIIAKTEVSAACAKSISYCKQNG
ncbi:alanine--tRNA ligase [Artemisia annua]|uniref:Alanine--tRNA ligase n=1 Tax=Artemisia annua TaxID=35608 RepID=A0A2U1KRW1_ARTAN|nr:alanine--tRNA ligase [Artemisia annua]